MYKKGVDKLKNGMFWPKKWGFLTKNAYKIAPNDPRELRVGLK